MICTFVTLGGVRRRRARRRRGRRAEDEVVPEAVQTVAVVERHGAKLDARLGCVAHDPCRAAAVPEALREDHLRAASDVLAEGEPGAGVGFGGDEPRIESDVGRALLDANDCPDRPRGRRRRTARPRDSRSAPRFPPCSRRLRCRPRFLPVTSSETRSACEYAGIGSDVSVVSSVAGVPLSASVISVPPTRVTARRSRLGSMRAVLTKSIDPSRGKPVAPAAKEDETSFRQRRRVPTTAGCARVPTSRRSAVAASCA